MKLQHLLVFCVLFTLLASLVSAYGAGKMVGFGNGDNLDVDDDDTEACDCGAERAQYEQAAASYDDAVDALDEFDHPSSSASSNGVTVTSTDLAVKERARAEAQARYDAGEMTATALEEFWEQLDTMDLSDVRNRMRNELVQAKATKLAAKERASEAYDNCMTHCPDYDIDDDETEAGDEYDVDDDETEAGDDYDTDDDDTESSGRGGFWGWLSGLFGGRGTGDDDDTKSGDSDYDTDDDETEAGNSNYDTDDDETEAGNSNYDTDDDETEAGDSDYDTDDDDTESEGHGGFFGWLRGLLGLGETNRGDAGYDVDDDETEGEDMPGDIFDKSDWAEDRADAELDEWLRQQDEKQGYDVDDDESETEGRPVDQGYDFDDDETETGEGSPYDVDDDETESGEESGPSCPAGSFSDRGACDSWCADRGYCKRTYNQDDLECFSCFKANCDPFYDGEANCEAACGDGTCTFVKSVGSKSCYGCERSCEAICASKELLTSMPDYTEWVESQLDPVTCKKSVKITMPRRVDTEDCTCYMDEKPTLEFSTETLVCDTACGPLACGESTTCGNTQSSCVWQGWEKTGLYQYRPKVE